MLIRSHIPYRFKLIQRKLVNRTFFFLKLRKFQGLERCVSQTPSSIRINELISKLMNKCEYYLEVGLERGNTFRGVNAKFKIGVDPLPQISKPWQIDNMKVIQKTSDSFYEDNSTKFDFVFLDGLHTWDQTYKDLINSLKVLTKRGWILIDDIVPSDGYAALRSQIDCQVFKHNKGIPDNYWMGDVWLIVPLLEKFHPELDFVTLADEIQHPQLLVWRKDRYSEQNIQDFTNRFRNIAHQFDYSNMFKFGIPDTFKVIAVRDFCNLIR